ncbi:MAG: hypothetical protein EOM20_19255, partial [Spartobacteria bacterium]|nr:hypothetical protein [Spartobacteria bacterium]
MTTSMPLYIIVLYISGGVTLTLATQAWFRRQENGALSLFFFLLCVGLSCFCYANNLGAPTLEQKIFWNQAEYLGGAYIPVLMLVVALTMTGQDRWLRPWPLAGLFLVPLIVMLGNWTNAWHDLYY